MKVDDKISHFDAYHRPTYTIHVAVGLVIIRHGRAVVDVTTEAVAVGRKNHYGSRSERGTRVAALFYSLIESAKLCSVEPRAYLSEAARRAIRNSGSVTLPRDFK